MVQPRQYVAAPAAQPLPYTLLSGAVVLDTDDPHNGWGFEYQSASCGVTQATIQACLAAMRTADNAGDVPGTLDDPLTADDGIGLIQSREFTAYALHRCRLVGGGVADAQAVAREKLARGEYRAYEAGFAAWVLRAAGVAAGGAEDLTPVPGTPLAAVDGLGLLEEWAADRYSGRPVIHMSRRTGVVLGAQNAVERQGNRLETDLGSIVVPGPGYTAASQGTVDGTTAGAGERWMWVTGAIVIRRSPVEVHDPLLRKTQESQVVTEGGAGLTSFTLTFDGQTTGSIAAAASAATVQAALEALSNIAPGDISVSGSAGGPYTVVFLPGGAYGDTDVPQMTATPTGGTGTVTVTTPAAGGQYTNEYDVLAERSVAISAECISGAVLVSEAAG